MWEFLPLVAIVVLFWLLVIRPAQRRQRSVSRLQDSLHVGDEVMLTSGFYGTVRAIDDDRLHLELAEGVVVGVARAAVANKVDLDPHHGLADELAADMPDRRADETGRTPDLTKEG